MRQYFEEVKLQVYRFYIKFLGRLTCKPLIHVIGDSHTWCFKYHFPFLAYHIGPATAFNIAAENSTTQSRRILFATLKNVDNRRDYVILSFGEIDARIHVYRRYCKSKMKDSYEQIIHEIINRYFLVVDELLSLRYRIILLGIPPANIQGNIYNYDYYAPPQEQIKIKKIFNRMLSDKCKINKIPYLELFETFSDENGLILGEYSMDEIHLSDRILYYVKYKLNSILNIKF